MRQSHDSLRRDRTVVTSRRLKNRKVWDGLKSVGGFAILWKNFCGRPWPHEYVNRTKMLNLLILSFFHLERLALVVMHKTTFQNLNCDVMAPQHDAARTLLCRAPSEWALLNPHVWSGVQTSFPSCLCKMSYARAANLDFSRPNLSNLDLSDSVWAANFGLNFNLLTF